MMPNAPRRYKQSDRKQADRYRGTAADRGYDYRWQKFREVFLWQNPLCEDCKAIGKLNGGSRDNPLHVHHKKKLSEHPELKFDFDNCMTLCTRCHSVRTARGE